MRPTEAKQQFHTLILSFVLFVKKKRNNSKET